MTPVDQLRAAPSIAQELIRTLLAGALAIAGGLLAHVTMGGLVLIVLAWRLAPTAGVFAAVAMLHVIAAFPDGGLGFANLHAVEHPLARAACWAVGPLWGLVSFLPAVIACEWKEQQRFSRRLAVAVLAWLVGPALIAPIVALHPLLGAGAWFPSLGVYGLIAMAGVIIAVASSPAPAFTAAMVMAVGLAANMTAPALHPIAAGLVALDTHVGAPSAKNNVRVRQLREIARDVDAALREGAVTVILPETVGRVSDGSARALDAALRHRAESAGASIWVGIEGRDGNGIASASMPVGDLVDGAHPVEPLTVVPIAMWSPLDGIPRGFKSWGPRRMATRHGELAPLFCFEAISAPAWVERTLNGGRPEAVAWISNQWWVASPHVGRVLRVAAEDFARLQGRPLLAAVAH